MSTVARTTGVSGAVPVPGLAIDLGDRRVAGWPLLFAVVLVELALTATITLVGFPSLWLSAAVFQPTYAATAGLVNATLLVNLLNVAVVLVGLLGMVGGFRAHDLGLDADTLPAGLAVTAAAWLVLQAVGPLLEPGAGLGNPLWADRGVGAVLGLLLAQLAGNALYEEALFRGVLFDQLVLKLRGRRFGFEFALLGSQAAFALAHVPSGLSQGYAPVALAESIGLLFLLGLLFALVYHRTGNLWIAVGLHALSNAPTMVTAPTHVGQFLVPVLMVGIVATWPWLRMAGRRLGHRAGAGR